MSDPVKGPKAREMVKNGALLLDVRTPDEFRGGHLDGALNVPVQELGGRVSELGDPGRPVVVYCQAGGRASMAEQLLRRAGFQEVFNLGGISAW